MDISVCIVNLNSIKYLKKCLESLKKGIGDNSFDDFVKDVNFNCSRDEALRISKKNSDTIDF